MSDENSVRDTVASQKCGCVYIGGTDELALRCPPCIAALLLSEADGREAPPVKPLSQWTRSPRQP